MFNTSFLQNFPQAFSSVLNRVASMGSLKIDMVVIKKKKKKKKCRECKNNNRVRICDMINIRRFVFREKKCVA